MLLFVVYSEHFCARMVTVRPGLLMVGLSDLDPIRGAASVGTWCYSLNRVWAHGAGPSPDHGFPSCGRSAVHALYVGSSTSRCVCSLVYKAARDDKRRSAVVNGLSGRSPVVLHGASVLSR